MVAVPLAILIHPSPTVRLLNIPRLVAVLLNPLLLIYLILLGVTAYNFQELSFLAMAKRALTAVAEAITFSVSDSMVSVHFII